MQDSRWVGGYLRVQISRRASPKVKAVYSTRVNVEKREKGEKRGIKVSSRGQKRKKERRRGRRKKKRRNVSRGCGRCRGRWWLAMVMVVVAVRENRVRPLAEEEFVSEERSVGKEEGRRWKRNSEILGSQQRLLRAPITDTPLHRSYLSRY